MASVKQMILLLFCFAELGIISGITDSGDAVVLRNLRQNWTNIPPNWADSDDPCSAPWDGIACENSRIIGLTLASMGIEGTLAGYIGQLSELQILDLSFNDNLSGSIPPAIGNLKKLETLSLSGCSLGGSIPLEIGNLIKLTFLALNSNKLSGAIPPNIGRLSNLHWLDLGDNHLSGPLPVSTGNTPGLDQLVLTEHFHFSQNQLSGTIPETLFHSQMTLIHILFDGNNFTGPIPASLGLLPNLIALRLDRNGLTGTVPSSLQKLTQLRELDLANNGLTGDVPDLTGMTSLNYVDLSNNLFTSSVAPSWFLNLRSLTVLMMQYDGLIGEVPTAIFSYPQLQELILSNNKFNGTVDLGSAVGSGLQLVDLRTNIIAGVQNEPQGNSTTLMLIGNPVCNSQLDGKSFCKLAMEAPSYSTISECTNQCSDGEGIRPRACRCARPYAGTLVFRSPLFRDLRNATRFQRLETDLREDLELGENSVSLQNAFFDADDYLRVHLELFPLDGDFFDRLSVQKLGSALSTQYFVPHEDEWGPYVFKAEPYIFDNIRGRKFSAAVVGGIATSSVVLLIGLVALGIYAVRAKRLADRASRVANPFADWARDEEERVSAPHLDGVGLFSFSDVNTYTDNFAEENKIGVGGYGQVYKGKLPSGELVAIKRAKQGSMQGALEFKTEIELLSRVHHTNLVRLVGFCYEKGEQMLLYEYIANGTLADGLSGKLGIQLGWIQRLRIALGSARGLAYLHEMADPPIIHRDVKTANILLDEHLRPKVADFGLSRLVADAEKENSSTVKGTLGYLDPEYFATLQLTEKSDVYNFGVVMLELLTGKKPIVMNRCIISEVRSALQSPDGLKEIVDPVIQDANILLGLERFVELAMKCVEQFSTERPTMREVVKEIESILENENFDSRSTSVASSVGESRVATAGRRHNQSMSTQEMSSNSFDSSVGGYRLRTSVKPK